MSIFRRSLTREFSAIGGSVVGVLVAIMLVQQLIVFLRRAASGGVEPEAVIALLGFSLLGYFHQNARENEREASPNSAMRGRITQSTRRATANAA